MTHKLNLGILKLKFLKNVVFVMWYLKNLKKKSEKLKICIVNIYYVCFEFFETIAISQGI